jgi:hypothetical protein
VKTIGVLEMSAVLRSANCLCKQRVALVLNMGELRIMEGTIVDAQIVSGGMQWNSTKLEIETIEVARES